jgi:hypothetical protein
MWLSEFDINPPPNSDGVDFDESQTPLYIDIDTIHTFTCGHCEYSWQVLNWEVREVIMCPDCGHVYEIDIEELQ